MNAQPVYTACCGDGQEGDIDVQMYHGMSAVYSGKNSLEAFETFLCQKLRAISYFLLSFEVSLERSSTAIMHGT